MIDTEYNALQDATEALATAETSTRSKSALEAIREAIEHINTACGGYVSKHDKMS